MRGKLACGAGSRAGQARVRAGSRAGPRPETQCMHGLTRTVQDSDLCVRGLKACVDLCVRSLKACGDSMLARPQGVRGYNACATLRRVGT